jgi:hypothetical protein
MIQRKVQNSLSGYVSTLNNQSLPTSTIGQRVIFSIGITKRQRITALNLMQMQHGF